MKKLNKELSKKVVVGLALYSVLGMQSVWAATEVKPTASYSDNNVVVTAGDWSLNGAAQGSQGSPYSYVYGGYSVASGVNVSGNKVSFSGNGITGISEGMELYGGESDSGSASGNSVEIGSNSTLTNVLYIEGAYGEVSSTNNKILIGGGEITGISDGMELYGGDSYSGSATGNSVEITGGKLTNVWYVEGAYSTNDATGNKLTISGGEITGIGEGVELYGGDSYSGSASGNSVKITGGTLTNVRYIEGAYSTHDATGSKLTISGGEIAGINDGMELFGGESYSGSATENSVEITGGTLTNVKAIYGGYSGSDAATGNTVNISGGIVDWYAGVGIIGGYSEDGDATGNTINISGGTVIGTVYGGKAEDMTTGETRNNAVNISGDADLTEAYLYGYNSASKPHSGNTLTIADSWKGSVCQISNFDSVVNNGDLTVTDSDYGVFVSGNSMTFQNNGEFKGLLKTQGGTMTFNNTTGTAEAYGISVTGTGTTTVTGLNGITAEKTTAAAKGIYSEGTDAGLTNSVSFVTGGGTITATSTDDGATGVYATGEGTTTVSNLGSIMATAGKSAMGIYSYGYKADPKNNVSFVTTGGTITARSTSNNVYGIRAEYKGTTSVENLVEITVEGQGNKAVYGIYSNGSDAGFANTVSFVADGKITATSSVHSAYGIYVTGTGTTTIDGSGAITISATAGEGKTAYGICVGSRSTLNIGTNITQPSVTLASGTTSVFMGTTNVYGTLNFESGSKLNVNMELDGTSIKNTGNLTAKTVTGVITLGDVNFTGTAENWDSQPKTVTLISGDCSGVTGFTGGSYDNCEYTYTFAEGTKNSTGLQLQVIQKYNPLPDVIQDDCEKETYTFSASRELTKDMGELNNNSRESFTIDGKEKELKAKGYAGVTITEVTDVMTVKDITLSGFNTFATNNGELTLEKVTFADEADTVKNDVVNNNKLYVKGNTTFNKGISGAGTTYIESGANVVYNDTTEKSFTNNVEIKSGATLDPVVSVFAEGVNVQVDGGGTLELQPGTLFANINMAENSVLKVAADDIKIDVENNNYPVLFADVTDGATQLDVQAGTLQLDGTAKYWDYYGLASGNVTEDNLWGIDKIVDDAGGFVTIAQQGARLAEFVNLNGAVGIEIRNIASVVEKNTSGLAGVQQGAISIVGQIADAVGENVGMAARPVQDGVYDKTIWAKYIDSKDDVSGMSLAGLSGDNKAKYHGVTLGADFYTSKKAIAGVALTYVTGDVTGNTLNTHLNNESKHYGISIYDRVTNGKSAWIYDLGYSHGKNEITQYACENVTADAKTNAATVGVKYEYAYNFKHSALIPFASLRYIRLQNKDYSNSNNADFSTDNQNLFQPKIGLTWTGDFAMTKSDWKFKPVAEVGYIWSMGDRETDGNMYANKRNFAVEYDTVDSSSYYTKLGLNFSRKKFTGGVSYRYAKGDAAKQNGWNVNLAWNF